MKMKKIWRVLAVLLMAAGTVLSSGQAVHAATLSSVTSGITTTGGRHPSTVLDPWRSSLSQYPQVTVKANNLAAYGSGQRITTKTTQISVVANGQLIDKDGDRITAYYADLLDKDGNSITTPSKTVSVTPSDTINISINQTFNVDLTKLRDQAPIYISYCFSTNYHAGYFNKYFSSKIDVNTLYPDITTTPITLATTTIKGTGANVGDTISNDVTGDTTTVGSDKTWSLPMSADALKDKKTITVTEYNDFGDRGTVTKDVTNPLTIAADKTTLNLSSDDVTKLEAMSDSDFADWVKSEANITGKSSSGSSADVKTDTTDLAAALKKVAANDSMPIDFYATDGTNKSATKTITLVKPGTVKFGTISSDIDFGSHGVPTATALYGPSSAWNVNINDTRTTGSKWYLYASATDLTSGSHKMPGYLTYRDANGQTSDLTKSTLIDSGDRGTSDTTDVTSNWTTDPKDTSKAGIFLDVEPGVFADSSIKYSGAVNWTLSDVPTP